MTNSAEPLAVHERAKLDQLESAIIDAQGMVHDASTRAGQALKEILEKRLYKHYGSFDDYCLSKWGFTGDYARKLISYYDVRRDVPEIENEHQARALTGYSSEQRKEIYHNAEQLANPHKNLWEASDLPDEEKHEHAEMVKKKPSAKEIMETAFQSLPEHRQFEAIKAKEEEAMRRQQCREAGRNAHSVGNAGRIKRIKMRVDQLRKLHSVLDNSNQLDAVLEHYLSLVGKADVSTP